MSDYFSDFPLAGELWTNKYKDINDIDVTDTWSRVASAIANIEEDENKRVKFFEFYSILQDFLFIPGGRITNGAGTKNNFLLNCGSAPLGDSIEDIYDCVKRTAILSKCNYGVGLAISNLRPENAPLSNGGESSGAVSFLKVFDASGEIIKTGGKNRRAALIAILRVDHPSIFQFIDAKRQEGILTNFNLSVGLTREFIRCVKEDLDFDLVFQGKVYQTVKAREIWDKLCYSGWMYNDPGFVMLDEIEESNNGKYYQSLDCTNP